MEPLEEAVLAALGRHKIQRLGVAVSGGSDSVALLHILKNISDSSGVRIYAATVDHGLRPEAAAEAAGVADLCRTLGVAHQTLHWRGWDGTGNLQNAARDARYGLMRDWAQALGLEAVALGHTAEDQAETVLMRLARRAGVDGLSAMSDHSLRNGVVWLRPLLNQRRGALQAYLAARGVSWVSDSSNVDLRFDRVKARAALVALQDLGIGIAELSEVARNMADARTALRSLAQDGLLACARPVHGGVKIDIATLEALPNETQRRVWNHALGWINARPYPPRRAALAAFMGSVGAGEGTVLGGCAVICRRGTAWLFRESAPVSEVVCNASALWDGRWRLGGELSGKVPDTYEIRALGANGLKQCGKWRDLDLPRGLLLGHPALWHGDTLIASPAAKPHEIWYWSLVRHEKAFFDMPL